MANKQETCSAKSCCPVGGLVNESSDFLYALGYCFSQSSPSPLAVSAWSARTV